MPGSLRKDRRTARGTEKVMRRPQTLKEGEVLPAILTKIDFRSHHCIILWQGPSQNLSSTFTAEGVREGHVRRGKTDLILGFLGPSSTWAYSKQVMCMIRDALPHNPPEVPMHFDGRSLEADWPCEKTIGPLSMAQLPSLETAHYLIDVVKFHLGQMYHLLDEQVFIGTLHEVYEGGLAEPLHDQDRKSVV